MVRSCPAPAYHWLKQTNQSKQLDWQTHKCASKHRRQHDRPQPSPIDHRRNEDNLKTESANDYNAFLTLLAEARPEQSSGGIEPELAHETSAGLSHVDRPASQSVAMKPRQHWCNPFPKCTAFSHNGQDVRKDPCTNVTPTGKRRDAAHRRHQAASLCGSVQSALPGHAVNCRGRPQPHHGTDLTRQPGKRNPAALEIVYPTHHGDHGDTRRESVTRKSKSGARDPQRHAKNSAAP